MLFLEGDTGASSHSLKSYRIFSKKKFFKTWPNIKAYFLRKTFWLILSLEQNISIFSNFELQQNDNVSCNEAENLKKSIPF